MPFSAGDDRWAWSQSWLAPRDHRPRNNHARSRHALVSGMGGTNVVTRLKFCTIFTLWSVGGNSVHIFTFAFSFTWSFSRPSAKVARIALQNGFFEYVHDSFTGSYTNERQHTAFVWTIVGYFIIPRFIQSLKESSDGVWSQYLKTCMNFGAHS